MDGVECSRGALGEERIEEAMAEKEVGAGGRYLSRMAEEVFAALQEIKSAVSIYIYILNALLAPVLYRLHTVAPTKT